MDLKILNGKLLSIELEEELEQRVARLKAGAEHIPTIVSYYNPDHAPSALYTSMKHAAAERVGINFEAREYSLSSDLKSLEHAILEDNENPKIDGVMLQMPAPGDLGEAVEKIASQKDVDGLTDEGRKIYTPATVRGTIKLIDANLDPNWIQKNIVILGASGIVGSLLIDVLKDQRNASNIKGIGRELLQESSQTYHQILKNADILISATGHEKDIDPDTLREGVVFINVGLGKPQESLIAKTSKYSPQFGGTGPMTVWALMENVADAFEKRVDVLKS